jgi:Leucine-rich repeat (LRR) protein
MIRLKLAAVTSALLLVAVAVGYLYLSRNGGTVTFDDSGLEKAVIASVSGKRMEENDAPLYRKDLERITRLDASDRGIESIRGIEQLTNLRILDLSGNRFSSIGPLAELSALTELSLRNTEVQDIRPLSKLINLRVLDLRETNLSAGGLVPLQGLTALEELNARESGIQDLDPIGGLINLRYLNIHSNSDITSLEPIGRLTRLCTLIMRNVPVGEQIVVLEGLHNLRRLNIRNTGVRDLRVLADLMRGGALQDGPSGNLTAEVDIRDNPINASAEEGPFGYDVLLPLWQNITDREPEMLPRNPTGEILINEVVTSNGSLIADSEGDYPDWIELYNPGEGPVDVGGFFLSDNLDRTDRWQFPKGTIIGAGEYMLLWASGKGEDGPADELHTSFALSAEGTVVVLTASDRKTRVDIVEVPPVPRDIGYGRNAKGDLVQFIDPTPGKTNEQGREYVPVRFSHEGGFYKAPFELALTCPGESADIYYTFNGSVPDPENNSDHTYCYSRPIPIDEEGPLPERIADIPTTIPKAEYWNWKPPEGEFFTGTVVRAVAYENGPRSRVYSESFFVDQHIREQFPLAMMSIIADPDDLFSYDTGIYIPGRTYEENIDYEGRWMQHPANYYQRKEVPAYIEFYEPDGFRGFALDGGVRIHGSWSRSHPLKSLRLYARKDYDRRNYFPYPVFPGAVRRNSHDSITRYKRLLLRSGQSLFRALLQDAVSHEHVRPYVEVDLVRSRPVIHFINGEYWGVKNLRERFDRFYLEANYGIDAENAAILEGPLGFETHMQYGQPKDRQDFQDLQDFIFNGDMSDAEQYRSVTNRMDIDSFIDYHIVRIYSGDTDGADKHVAMWRVRDGDPDAEVSGVDGRWRFHTWDLDNALLVPESDSMTFYANDRTPAEQRRISEEMLEEEADSSEIMNVYNPRYTRLFVDLLQNREFRHRFINRFADLLNSLYRGEVYAETIEEAASIIEPEIRRHIRRWSYPNSYQYWRSKVEQHVEFVHRRPEIQREHIVRYFEERYSEPEGIVSVTVELPNTGGTVRINSITLNSGLPGAEADPVWKGSYFSEIPVELEAVPDEGFRFAGWEGDVAAEKRAKETIKIPLTDDVRVKAVFTEE